MHANLHRIAYSLQMRGNDGDVPTLLFYGAPWALIKDVCIKVHALMSQYLKNIIIEREHSCRERNGKCYYRIAVTIVELDENFMSLDNFVSFIIAQIQSMSNCKIKKYKLEKFLNL